MDNCKNCGAPLSLDEAYCPHCGTPNPEAQEHLRKLNEIKIDYVKTREQVVSEVKKTKEGYRYLIILLILLLANLLLIPLYGASYGISSRLTANSISKEEMTARMNELLKAEEYIEFYALCERYDISYSDYPEYVRLYYLTSDYKRVCSNVSDYLYQQESYSDPLLKACESISDFEESYESYQRWEETGNEKYGLALRKEYEQFLKTFLKLTDEDIAGIPDMSSSELVVLVTGRLYDEN